MKDKIHLLNQPGAYSILLELLRRKDETIYITELLNVLNNYPRLCSLLEDMEVNDLVKISRLEKRQERRIVKLTEKGETLANYLDLADKLLSDENTN